MSWWITLNQGSPDGETIEADEPHGLEGGTYGVGVTELELNVTYNYGQLFRRVIEGGIDTLQGMTGRASLPIIDAGISKLGDDVSDDYWEATEGNAKRALLGLRRLATLAPDGFWRVS